MYKERISITAFTLGIAVLAIAALFHLSGPAGSVTAAGIADRTASHAVTNVGGTTVDTIATGLNNPRGLNFSPNGDLYVAEAGTGGSVPCGTGAEGNPPPPLFYGPTASITRIDLNDNTYSRVITGLPSKSVPSGAGANGAHDIVFRGRTAYITTGWGGNPTMRTTVCGPAGNNFDRLVRAKMNGDWSLFADLGAYEVAANPHLDSIDSNPYGLLARNGDDGNEGDSAGRNVVVDAGGNDLLSVDPRGNVSTLAVFPNRMVPFGAPGNMVSMQAVPTTVARGRDGRYYVGQLTGFPFPVGGANVYSVPSAGGTPQIYASGFTNIIDIAFGHDGSLYVLEFDKNGLLNAGAIGSLIRVAPDGTRTEIAAGMLTSPGGVAIGRDGAIYVTNRSVQPGSAGQVLRITQ